MKNYDRMDRVNELVKRELGERIEREVAAEVNGLLTVTGVRVAPDLRSARVMISFLGPEPERKKVLPLLERERGDLQHALAAHTALKYTPVLDFRLDSSLERGDHVLGLIDEIEGHDDTE